MKLSIRHFAAAPLLIPALAISYFLVASLQVGPVIPEQDAWMADKLISTAFASYFFAGYFLVVTRKHAVLAIITLWAWHLFVLIPYLAPCEGYRNFDRFRQTMGFGVPEFAIAIALVAIASSVALYMRYRRINGFPAPDRRNSLRLCITVATVISAALAAGAYWMVAILRELLPLDLPTLTLMLFYTYRYWIILPLACAAGLFYVNVRKEFSEKHMRIALTGAVWVIILLNMVSSAFVVAALGWLRKLGCAV